MMTNILMWPGIGIVEFLIVGEIVAFGRGCRCSDSENCKR